MLPDRDRVVLTVLLLLALNDEPLLLTRITEALRSRLTPESLDLLGVDPRLFGPSGHTVRDRLYFVVHRAFHRLLTVIDSAPGTPGRRLPATEVDTIRARRNSELCRQRQSRCLWLANQLLHLSFRMVPTHQRAEWVGDVCVDATPVPVWGRRGTPSRSSRDPDTLCSPDIDAGWYTREADHRDPTNGRDPKSVWAYEATITTMTADTPGTPPNYPLLAVALSFDKPGHRVAENALTCLTSLRDRGLPARYLTGDRAYFPNSKPDKLQLPARALGYELVFDYRNDQLGIMTSRHGAIQVEGAWYCPSMPTGLIDATREYRDNFIDHDTYLQRLARRADYLLTPKARPDADGYRPMRCPAAGPAPSVACPPQTQHHPLPARAPHRAETSSQPTSDLHQPRIHHLRPRGRRQTRPTPPIRHPHLARPLRHRPQHHRRIQRDGQRPRLLRPRRPRTTPHPRLHRPTPHHGTHHDQHQHPQNPQPPPPTQPTPTTHIQTQNRPTPPPTQPRQPPPRHTTGHRPQRQHTLITPTGSHPARPHAHPTDHHHARTYKRGPIHWIGPLSVLRLLTTTHIQVSQTQLRR